MQNTDDPRFGCPFGHNRVLDAGDANSPSDGDTGGASNKPEVGGGGTAASGAAKGDADENGDAGSATGLDATGADATGASIPTTPWSDTADVHSLPL